MLSLRQTGIVEEYTATFQALQYDITMHNNHYDDIFFASTYVAGPRDEIKAVVEPHVLVTVDRAVVIAKIQQRTLERNKAKANRPPPVFRNQATRTEPLPQPTNTNLQRVRQLRDYRKANNLCFYCGDKYELGHHNVCSKHPEPQINAIVVNDLDKEKITEEQLTQLAIEDSLTEDFCQLSLNAMSGANTDNSIKLKTLVTNKVMLILLDSGCSHSFVSKQFADLAKLPTTPIP